MKLEGSCHCKAVRFTVHSAHPYPFNLCYCSICRKTGGGGGYAINLGGDFSTLQVQGEEHITVYHPKVTDEDTGETKESLSGWHFCRICGSALWVWDSRWPELVHPSASAIDTDLPAPPERVHLMTGSKASWVEIREDEDDKIFKDFPDESIEEWHKRLGLEDREP